jgi:hypothetical protein
MIKTVRIKDFSNDNPKLRKSSFSGKIPIILLIASIWLLTSVTGVNAAVACFNPFDPPYESPKGYGMWLYGDTNQSFVEYINAYNSNSINHIKYLFPHTGEVKLPTYNLSYNKTTTAFYKSNIPGIKVYPMLDSVKNLKELNDIEIVKLAQNISAKLNSDINADGLHLDIEPYNYSLIKLVQEIRKRTCKPISVAISKHDPPPALFQNVEFAVLMLYGFESNVTPIFNYTRDAPHKAREFLSIAQSSNGYAMIGVPAKATKNEWEYKINVTIGRINNSNSTMEEYLRAALNATNMARNESNEQNYVGISIWNLKSTPGRNINNETLFPYIISPKAWEILMANQ